MYSSPEKDLQQDGADWAASHWGTQQRQQGWTGGCSREDQHVQSRGDALEMGECMAWGAAETAGMHWH